MEPGVPPLILTLALDASTFGVLDGLRKRHFPPERNVVPAHVTLFHALPGADEPAIRDELARVCRETAPFAVRFPGVRSLGRGVAVVAESPALNALRGRLANVWVDGLRPQDRQGYRPHVTIQNKVEPAAARALLAELEAAWTPFDGRAEGLRLWRYLGGPWERAASFEFTEA